MNSDDTFAYFLIAVCIVLVLLPPKYDPAIRWKEFNMRWAKRIEEKKNRR